MKKTLPREAGREPYSEADAYSEAEERRPEIKRIKVAAVKRETAGPALSEAASETAEREASKAAEEEVSRAEAGAEAEAPSRNAPDTLPSEAPAEASLFDGGEAEVSARPERPHIVPDSLNYIPSPDSLYEEEDGEDEEAAEAKPAVLPAREDVYVSEDKHHVLLELLDWVKYVLIAAIIGLSLNLFVIQRSEVDGSSMLPTLFNKDQLLVEKVSVHFALPSRFSIVTIDASKLEARQEDQLYVKRVIGLPGETVDIKNGKVWINGEALDEPYLPDLAATEAPPGWKPVTVPEDHVFVLGDNRGLSADSRLYGMVPGEALTGHVLIRIYPFSRFGPP